MRKILFILSVSILALYLALHLVLGSSPVQKRVLQEIQAALAKYGLDLQMESIEFSAFSPKIYLNRVTLKANQNSPISLPEPLAIDKIKIQFQPLALVYRQIVIDDLTLFHPRIFVPSADRLYQKVNQMLSSRKAIRVDSGSFPLIFKKVGVVDALFNVASKEPAFALRTQSFSAFLQNNASGQRSVTVESNNLEIERGKILLNLKRIDFDVDITQKSLRVNRAIVDSDDVSLNVKGVSSLPFIKGKGPDSVSLSYDVQLFLPLLNQIPELDIPKLTGKFASAGTLRKAAQGFTGNGTVKYDGVSVKAYAVGAGSFSYAVDNHKLGISAGVFQYANGEIRGPSLNIDLRDRFNVEGALKFRDVTLEGILAAVHTPDVPVRMRAEGTCKVSGSLAGPFELKAEIDGAYRDLLVLHEDSKGVTAENTLLNLHDGTLNTTLVFTIEKMLFGGQAKILGGNADLEGFLGFKDDTAKVKIKAEGASLTQMGHIAALELGGTANLAAEVEVLGTDVKVAGNFDIQQGEISKLMLGPVKGEAFYQNELLSFENLEVPATETIKANGYVDFKTKDVLYKFYVDAKRAEIDQAFSVFSKRKLSFPVPHGGDASARLTIEGGEEGRGVTVTATGQAKNFKWYDEQWLTSNFSLKYREDDIDLERVSLTKKTGTLEIRARFKKNSSRLSFVSHALKIEELDRFEKAPLTGEVNGDWTLEGEPGNPFARGSGELKLSKTSFRGNVLPDSTFRLKSEAGSLEFLTDFSGDRLRGRFVKGDLHQDLLSLNFQDFDFAPVITVFAGKDIPSLSSIVSTGNISLTGDFSDLPSLKGSGSLNQLDLDLKGTPMRNRQPIQIKFDETGIRADRFSLVGPDSQLTVDLLYQPQKKIQASLDGKLDLQFLQPLIPGLDYGVGKVSVGLRVTGVPEKFEMLGNFQLEDGTLRLTGLADELKSVQARLSASHERISVDKFEATVNGGTVAVEGDIRINRFNSLIPNLRLEADRITLKLQESLALKLSGDFSIKGTQTPYTLAGDCQILEGSLTSFTASETARVIPQRPILNFDLRCEAKDRLFVKTDMMDAEFRGNLHVVGDNAKVGLTGSVDSLRGNLVFRDTPFRLSNANVRFESSSQIAPRFNVMGRAYVREQRVAPAQEYEINLQAYGTPAEYKIRLTSAPALAESEIISLLLLGITSRTQDGNYGDLGTTIAGQIPLQSKIQSELGVDIKVKSQSQIQNDPQRTAQRQATVGSDPNAPTVQIGKSLTKKTKLSYSNTLETIPSSELRLEQILNDNLTVNATVERSQGGSTTQPAQSYGLDLRYRFQFE